MESKVEFETFVGDDEQHYWRLRAANGQVIAVGGEGYATKGGAIRAIATVQKAILATLGDVAEDHAEVLAKSVEGG